VYRCVLDYLCWYCFMYLFDCFIDREVDNSDHVPLKIYHVCLTKEILLSSYWPQRGSSRREVFFIR